MGSETFTAWLPKQIAAYAANKVRSGNWLSEGALARAQTETAALLPQGLATAGQQIFEIWSETHRDHVGVLWIKRDSGGAVYIYSMEIAERFRRQGLAAATFRELERNMREAGAARLHLHVFGFNTPARRLYESLGFQVTNLNMAKEL